MGICPQAKSYFVALDRTFAFSPMTFLSNLHKNFKTKQLTMSVFQHIFDINGEPRTILQHASTFLEKTFKENYDTPTGPSAGFTTNWIIN